MSTSQKSTPLLLTKQSRCCPFEAASLRLFLCSSIVLLFAGNAFAQAHSQTRSAKGATLVTQRLLREPPAPVSCAEQQGNLVNMLVLGDSIMWGQGLKEESKISFQVQNWLCRETHRPVRVWREAHSGAVLDESEAKIPTEAGATNTGDKSGTLPGEKLSALSDAAKPVYLPINLAMAANTALEESPNTAGPCPQTSTGAPGECDGEINVSGPTIPQQLEHALKHFKGPEVDFVLMDGCINDFGFTNFIDASMPLDRIDKLAKVVCYERMSPVLADVARRFPNARIIVTGYYPVITEKSARNVLFRFLFGTLFSREKQKWFFPNAKEQLFQKLIATSKQWAESSNTWLRLSVAEANEKAASRIAFAPTNYKPASPFGSVGGGFAAPKQTSLLWTSLLNSTGRGGLSKFFYVLFVLNFHALRPNDEVYSNRKKVCQDTAFNFLLTRKCQLAAYGHPNKKGVAEYVETVTRELRQVRDTTDWLRTGTSVSARQ
jgi:hypothetical protein